MKSKLKRFIKGCFNISVFQLQVVSDFQIKQKSTADSRPRWNAIANMKQLLSEIKGNILV